MLHLRLNGLTMGVIATWVWIVLAGLYVHHHHQVPSLVEYKSAEANVVACAAPDIRGLNNCLDRHYAGLLEAWRVDAGTEVVLPPALAWIAVLLHSLATGAGLFRRRQRA